MKIFLLFLTFVLPAIAVSAQDNKSDAKITGEIRQVLDAQTAAWNRGDLEGFMQGYWNSPEMTFVSGDKMTKGWQPTLDRYKKSYNSRAKMGVLSFSELQTTITGKTSAVVLGRFTLVRENDKPTGLFTLNFRKFKEGWRIIIDHTS